jgi:hypothetical protein
MKYKVGLWIDHRNAIVIYIAESEVGIKTIKSNVDKQSHDNTELSSSAPFDKHKATKADIQNGIYAESIEKFYGKVYSGVKNAESVLIFGPDEAKVELKAYIEKRCIGKLVVGIETVDRMSDRQIIAKVSKYFKDTITPPAVVR